MRVSAGIGHPHFLRVFSDRSDLDYIKSNQWEPVCFRWEVYVEKWDLKETQDPRDFLKWFR